MQRTAAAIARVHACSTSVLHALDTIRQFCVTRARARLEHLDKQLQDAARTYDVNAQHLRALANVSSIDDKLVERQPKAYSCVVVVQAINLDVQFSQIYSCPVKTLKGLQVDGNFHDCFELCIKDTSNTLAEWVTTEDITLTFNAPVQAYVTGEHGKFKVACACSKTTTKSMVQCTVRVNGVELSNWMMELYQFAVSSALSGTPTLTFYKLKYRTHSDFRV